MSKKSTIKIEFIDKGFREVLSSSGVYNMVSDEAQAIAARAGEGFERDVVKGYNGSRWIAFVHATTQEAAVREAEEKILSGALL